MNAKWLGLSLAMVSGAVWGQVADPLNTDCVLS